MGSVATDALDVGKTCHGRYWNLKVDGDEA